MRKAEVTEYNIEKEERDAGKKLLPCPFCGNSDIDFYMAHPQYFGKQNELYWCYWFICCPKCGAEMENGRLEDQSWDEAKDEIISSWNRRTVDYEQKQ